LRYLNWKKLKKFFLICNKFLENLIGEKCKEKKDIYGED